jgi:polysaccharide pyruvyl transferase CsaB
VTTPRRPRIFLVGYYGMRNLGDEAIRSAIEQAAAARGLDIAWFASRDRADPDPRSVPVGGRGLWRYVAAILRADRVVLGGGGILKDEGPRLPLELAATALLARLLGKPVNLLAVGVGPFYTRTGRWLARLTARLADVRTVRDQASAEALRALGISRVEVGGDPTFAMIPATSPAPADGPDRRVVVSLRPWYGKDADGGVGRQTALRSAVAEALAPLVADGWTVSVVSLYWPRDLGEAHVLAADPRLQGARVIERELDWSGLIEALRGADLVLAMRYHAAAAAASLGLPVVTLAYEPKVRSLAEELGLPRFDVDDPTALLPDLVDRVVAISRDPDPARPDAAALEHLRARADRALDLALLGSPRDHAGDRG